MVVYNVLVYRFVEGAGISIEDNSLNLGGLYRAETIKLALIEVNICTKAYFKLWLRNMPA